MKQILFQLGVKMLFAVLTPELAEELYNKLIAKIDEYVKGTSWSIDDIIWNTIKAGGQAVKDIADTALDFVEDYVAGTNSTVDDALVLPICDLFRQITNIPDDD